MDLKRIALAAWHLIEKTAIKHPPKVLMVVGGFFVFHTLLVRWRGSRWAGAVFQTLVVTSLLIFIVACIMVLFSHAGLINPLKLLK